MLRISLKIRLSLLETKKETNMQKSENIEGVQYEELNEARLKEEETHSLEPLASVKLARGSH